MEIHSLTASSLERCVRAASKVLQSGGVVLYPTDTLYGLGADAFSDEAVARLYAIKGRPEGKPIHCVVADLEMAAQVAQLSDLAQKLARRFLPGALTLILKKRPNLAGGIARGMDTIGIRIPKSDFCHALAREFGAPYTTTSANRAGEASPRSVSAIAEQLGDRAAGIALAIDAGALPKSAPSTVVDLSGARPIIVREGAISAAELFDEVRVEY